MCFVVGMKWPKVRSFSAYARAESHLVQKTNYGAVGMLLNCKLHLVLYFPGVYTLQLNSTET